MVPDLTDTARGRRRVSRRRPAACLAVLAVVAGTLAWGVPAASAHGGAVGATAGASPTGPLTAVVTLSGATWLGDGDPASGLTVSATASGPASAGPVPLAETSEGSYRGTLSFPTGGSYSITVSWSGNESVPGATTTSVTVEGAAPTPTAPPSGGGGSSSGGGGSSTGGSSSSGDGPTVSGGTTPTTTAATGVDPNGTTADHPAATVVTGPRVVLVPDRAPRRSYVMVTVAVPNPSASASVDAVTVDLPDGILGATTQALPGWTATVTRATTAQGASVPQVERITWTAESAVLAPGELQQLTVLIGPLPSTGRIARLPVTVGLSDGTARTWGPSTPVLRLTRAARGNASAHG